MLYILYGGWWLLEQARALGEVQIREALQELRAWERSAEITLLTQASERASESVS